MELDALGVVEHAEQVLLYGVGVAGLTQDLQQGRVRHEEKPREGETFLLKISVQNSNYILNQICMDSQNYLLFLLVDLIS